MTKEQILAMEAGIELDGWVAEQVMGIRTMIRAGLITNENGEPLPAYSEDISAAWGVVEKVRELGWSFNIQVWQKATTWFARCQKYNGLHTYVNALGKTAPEAICRAALLIKLNTSLAIH